jgi:hypothetical protein
MKVKRTAARLCAKVNKSTRKRIKTGSSSDRVGFRGDFEVS